MSPQPLLPGEGAFPADQIRIPCPPSRFESSTGGVLRRPHGVPVAESYRRNVVRIWLGGADQDVVDLVPDTDTVTTGPASLFGPDCGPVFFLSGTQAFGRLTTRDEDAATLRALRWRLDFDSWDWCPAVATVPHHQGLTQVSTPDGRHDMLVPCEHIPCLVLPPTPPASCFSPKPKKL